MKWPEQREMALARYGGRKDRGWRDRPRLLFRFTTDQFFFIAIRLLEYNLTDWRFRKIIRLLGIGLGTQNIGLSNIRLKKTIGCPALFDLMEETEIIL